MDFFPFYWIKAVGTQKVVTEEIQNKLLRPPIQVIGNGLWFLMFHVYT